MNLSAYPVSACKKGELHIGPRPTLDTLEEWASELQSRGIDLVVSLIENTEVIRHQLTDEESILAGKGIRFIHFPVDDFDIPDNNGAFASLTKNLAQELEAGLSLFIHCAGGVGRAGTLSSCLLTNQGFDADEAMQLVSLARGKTVPETDQQADFVRRFSVGG